MADNKLDIRGIIEQIKETEILLTNLQIKNQNLYEGIWIENLSKAKSNLGKVIKDINSQIAYWTKHKPKL